MINDDALNDHSAQGEALSRRGREAAPHPQGIRKELTRRIQLLALARKCLLDAGVTDLDEQLVTRLQGHLRLLDSLNHKEG